MNLSDLVGSFSCEKAINVETWKNLDPDGSFYFPYQHKAQFTLPTDQGATPSYLIAKFTGAMDAKSQPTEKIGKLVNIQGLGYGLLFEQNQTTPYAWYFFPVEFAGEKEIGGKKNYLMIMDLNNQRVAVRLER